MLLWLKLQSIHLSSLIFYLVREVSYLKGRHWGEWYKYFFPWSCAFDGGFDSIHCYTTTEIRWHDTGQTHGNGVRQDTAVSAIALLWIHTLPLANHVQCVVNACQTNLVQNQWPHTAKRQICTFHHSLQSVLRLRTFSSSNISFTRPGM